MRFAPARSRQGQKAWLLPTLLGTLMGVLPHLAQRLARGTWVFLADNDDLYYAMVARTPFWGGWSVRDPFANAHEALSAPYAWGLVVPMAKLAALLGDTPAAFLLGWRVLGGALLGLGLWLFLVTVFARSGRRLARLAGPWGAAGLAAVVAAALVADPGLDYASLPLETLFETIRNLLLHRLPRSNPGWYVHLRIVSPLCGLGVLFAFLALLSRPRLTLHAAISAGLLLGVLFNIHFFSWTPPVGLLLVLLAAQFLPDRARRWFGAHQPPALLLLCLGIGVAAGLPQLLYDFSRFGDSVIKETLDRTPRGLALSWHNHWRFLYLVSPRLWFDCGLAVAAAIRVRALRVGSLLALISFAMANSAVVTSLEFENYKWLHAFQPLVYTLCWAWAVHEGVRFFSSSDSTRRVRAGVIALVATTTFVALIWIPRECLHTPQAAMRSDWYAEIRGLQPVLAGFADDASLVTAVEAQVALLFTRSGVLYEVPYTKHAFISDKELIERHALSAWVLGVDRSRLDLQSALSPSVLDETRPRWAHIREEYARAVAATKVSDLDKFRVRYALTTCTTPPALDTGPWRERGRSGRWCAWERAESHDF